MAHDSNLFGLMFACCWWNFVRVRLFLVRFGFFVSGMLDERQAKLQKEVVDAKHGVNFVMVSNNNTTNAFHFRPPLLEQL